MKHFVIRVADQKAEFFVELMRQLSYVDFRELTPQDAAAATAEQSKANLRDMAKRVQQSHDNDMAKLRQIMANIDKQRKSR